MLKSYCFLVPGWDDDFDFFTELFFCYHMYLCNTKRPWQTKIICAFTNIVKMQKLGKSPDWQPLMSLGYFQKRQKADPPLKCRGRCSSSTACLENNSRFYVINAGSPLVNINTIQRSRVGTHPLLHMGSVQKHFFTDFNPYSTSV